MSHPDWGVRCRIFTLDNRRLELFQLTKMKPVESRNSSSAVPVRNPVGNASGIWRRAVTLSVLFGWGFSAISAISAHAQALYGATAAGGPGVLSIIDPATGALVQNIGPLNDAAGLNYPITGLAFHPITGALYGSTGNNPAGTAARLVTIDITTALVTVVGSFNTGLVNSGGTPSTMADLAFDAAGGLYGVGSIGGPQLFSINPATAQATVIGSSGLTSTTGGGLAISVANSYFGTPTASRFGTYDPGTGAYTDIANPAKPTGGGGYGALDFDGNGILFGLNVGAGSPPPTHLVTINPGNGRVTAIGASIASLDAIAFRPGAVPEVNQLIPVLGCVGLGLVLLLRRKA